MIGVQATQGVLITLIIVVGGVIITWIVGRKAGEPAVMQAQAKIDEESLREQGNRMHRERMQQIEYERARDNHRRDTQRNELERIREQRALGLGDEAITPTKEPEAGKKDRK